MSNCCSKVTSGSVACTSTGHLVEPRIDCDCQADMPVVIKGVCTEDKLEGFLKPGERNWTQLFVPEVLCIPEAKPDVEQIISASVCVEIISQRVIRTPAICYGDDLDACVPVPVMNEEGLYSTGRKLVIEGILRQKITYVAANEQQSVHTADFDVPFSVFIVLNPCTLLSTRFKIETCVEDVFVCGSTPRQIFKNVTLIIKATPIVCTSWSSDM